MLGFLLVMLATVSTGDGMCGVSGTITNEMNGAPLVGATVMVIGTSFGAMTDGFGMYEISGLPTGTYSLRASIVGMGEFTIEGVILSPEETGIMDFVLAGESPSFWYPDLSILI